MKAWLSVCLVLSDRRRLATSHCPSLERPTVSSQQFSINIHIYIYIYIYTVYLQIYINEKPHMTLRNFGVRKSQRSPPTCPYLWRAGVHSPEHTCSLGALQEDMKKKNYDIKKEMCSIRTQTTRHETPRCPSSKSTRTEGGSHFSVCGFCINTH